MGSRKMRMRVELEKVFVETEKRRKKRKEKRDNGEAGKWQKIEDGRRETGTLGNIITSRDGEGKDSGTKRNRAGEACCKRKLTIHNSAPSLKFPFLTFHPVNLS